MEFLITLIATIVLFIGAALVVNYCRRRAARTRHPLTAMCHQTGGSMCGSCGSTLLQKEPFSGSG